MNMLDVQDVVKCFGTTIALDHTSFSLRNNDFLVLAGPSNSGKTTLFRLLSGLEQPDAGTIWLNGVNIGMMKGGARKVALVSHKYGVANQLSVYDNIAQPLRFRRQSKKIVDQQVQSALEILELQHIQKMPVKRLSGGEIQRVVIARAMVRDADLYLFDEPLAQLDPHTHHRAQQAIQLVHRLKGAISIYATQHPASALTIATRLALIYQGRIQQIGTPEEVLRRPANLFVAEYLHQPRLNQVPASVHATDTGYLIQADGFNFILPPAWRASFAQLANQTSVILGIRPNTILSTLTPPSPDASGYIHIPAQITHIDHLMGKWTMQLRVGQQTSLVAELKDIHHPSLQTGTRIEIGLHPVDICLFHPTARTLLPPPSW
ncbi:ABC transporter ATP-binding protein [Dictyobacter aurantiacus]|uniref:ABC transporter ATP-binding protein n=1 Tax=Dictyobacter aurantiacus TaxID=1936993 RepID=A0A401ZAH9_9CHLR|nr:ABC transporter ATP-binding protein [Dictyobacter aurantiacus]GCE03833.1 ABC transporter ATP-binding protein [Dictyobacter aurantiacus]